MHNKSKTMQATARSPPQESSDNRKRVLANAVASRHRQQSFFRSTTTTATTKISFSPQRPQPKRWRRSVVVLVVVVVMVVVLSWLEQKQRRRHGNHNHRHNSNAPSFPFHFLFTTIAVVSAMEVDSPRKCQVKDKYGNHVSLRFPPSGVKYNSAMNQLHCLAESSCREWSISNCDMVKCLYSHACQEAHFTNNVGVFCYAYAACQEAKFVQAHNVICGMEATNACMQAVIETDRVLNCLGSNACVSDPDTQLTVQAGAKGMVRCSHGAGRFSCQHMTVVVNHAHRACFARGVGTDEEEICAVVCEGLNECDEPTIHFKVVASP